MQIRLPEICLRQGPRVFAGLGVAAALFGGWKTAELFLGPHDPAKSNGQRATQPSAFGEDADGELFLCDANGPVYRIVAADQ